LNAAIELAVYLKRSGQRPEQVQDFYPTPGTLSTGIYYPGLDPRTMQSVYVPRTQHEKGLQRALMQYYLPGNFAKVREALRMCDREDLIGLGPDALVPPARDNTEGLPTQKEFSRRQRKKKSASGRRK
jgi:radical SAM superfamily enzyme YgiQ (UPF0313 family)